MSKKQDEIPDWKIPPANEIKRRQVGSGATRKLSQTDRRRKTDVGKDIQTYREPRERDGALDSSTAHITNNKCPSENEPQVKKDVRTFLPKLGNSAKVVPLSPEKQTKSTHTKKISGSTETRARSKSPVRNVLPKSPVTDSSRKPLVVIPRPETSHHNQQTSDFSETPEPPPHRPRSCSSSSSIRTNPSLDADILLTSQNASETMDVSPSGDIGDSSDEYDTDCEPEISSEFRKLEYKERRSRQDSDIGHLTYDQACQASGVKPRGRIARQLWQTKLDMRYGGLLTSEVKALATALLHNSRIDDVDLSHNGMDGEALSSIFKTLKENIYSTKLKLAGNVLDVDSSMACCAVLTQSNWLVSLDLSDCSISDKEVGYLAQGIQVNEGLQRLNLSKNKIGLAGGLQLGRAFGENKALVYVNLRWNHIRGGGAVAMCKSLQKNKKLEELDLSWNGIGFEGSLALGESLRVNKSLKRLSLENNRINWDCAPYIARGLYANRTLEVLDLGQNPISMEGCAEILSAIAKPASAIRFLGLAGVPINTHIALQAADLAKDRDFTLEHGGILSTKDVIGIQRTCREDPFSLLIRYLSVMGIRVMDLFRMFDKDNNLYVSRQKFIQGLKRVRVPLDDDDLQTVVKRLQSNKRGQISYQELANTVRNRIREDRLEDKRQEMMEKKKREERRRILQSDKPLDAPSSASLNHLTSLYSMYGTRERNSMTHVVLSPIAGSFSRRGSEFKTLPRLRSDKNFSLVGSATGRKTPRVQVRDGTASFLHSAYSNRPISRYDELSKGSRAQISGNDNQAKTTNSSSYVSQLRWRQAGELLRRQRFL